MTAILELEAVGRRYGELLAVDGVTLAVDAGRAPRADRPERRREVDALPPDLGHLAPDVGTRPLRAAGT